MCASADDPEDVEMEEAAKRFQLEDELVENEQSPYSEIYILFGSDACWKIMHNQSVKISAT